MTSESTYGFIGVGVMGWGMAMNLRGKLPPLSKLIVCEVSEARRDQFIAEAGPKGSVGIAATPQEVAAHAVSVNRPWKYHSPLTIWDFWSTNVP